MANSFPGPARLVRSWTVGMTGKSADCDGVNGTFAA
jgi:hypothetical protein